MLGLATAGCGSSSVTIHGDVSAGGGAFGGPVTIYGYCSQDAPSPGDQVTVTDPNGKVIGTGTLRIWSHIRATADGVTMYGCDMPFTIKGVPAEQRYGFEINNAPGKIWVSNVNQPVTLDVGSG
jgi:hypothetical protein